MVIVRHFLRYMKEMSPENILALITKLKDENDMLRYRKLKQGGKKHIFVSIHIVATLEKYEVLLNTHIITIAL